MSEREELLALAAELEACGVYYGPSDLKFVAGFAITEKERPKIVAALRLAARPQAEPVGWITPDALEDLKHGRSATIRGVAGLYQNEVDLYAAPSSSPSPEPSPFLHGITGTDGITRNVRIASPSLVSAEREALEFYAKEWRPNSDGDCSEPHLTRTWMEPTDALMNDEGQKARAALTDAGGRG